MGDFLRTFALRSEMRQPRKAATSMDWLRRESFVCADCTFVWNREALFPMAAQCPIALASWDLF